MNIDFLRTFYTVAQTKSFSAAAEALAIDQSNVSRKIRAFEKTVGKPLFVRRPHGVFLTMFGENLVAEVAQALTHLDRIRHNVAMPQSGRIEGQLTVAAPELFIAHYLATAIPDYLRTHPRVRAHLRPLASDDPKATQADLILQPHPTEHRGFICQRIFSTRQCLYASRAYLAEHGAPIRVQDLDRHKLIAAGEVDLRADADQGGFWPLTVGRRDGDARAATLTVNPIAVRAQLAELGLGITCLPAGYVALWKSTLVPVLSQAQGARVEAYAVFPTFRKDAPTLKSFVQHLQRYYASLMEGRGDMRSA